MVDRYMHRMMVSGTVTGRGESLVRETPASATRPTTSDATVEPHAGKCRKCQVGGVTARPRMGESGISLPEKPEWARCPICGEMLVPN